MSNERTSARQRDVGASDAGGSVLPVLEAAGLVAPILRNADERTLRRPVKVYDRETGEVLREATVREVVGGLAKATALGLEVVEGVRPKGISCRVCGRVVSVRKVGATPTMCRAGEGCRTPQATCATPGCETVPPPHAFHNACVIQREGKPWVCFGCRGRLSPQTRCGSGCGAEMPYQARRRRGISGGTWVCPACRRRERVTAIPRQAHCAGFGRHKCTRKPPAKAFVPANHKAREGRPWRCKIHAAMDAAHRARVAKRQASEAA